MKKMSPAELILWLKSQAHLEYANEDQIVNSPYYQAAELINSLQIHLNNLEEQLDASI